MDAMSDLWLYALLALTSFLNLGYYLAGVRQRAKERKYFARELDAVSRIGTIEARLRSVEYQTNSNKNNIMRLSDEIHGGKSK